MKLTDGEVPVPVLMATGMDAEGLSPEGTVTTHVVLLGQETPASIPAKVTVMSPEGLNRLEPVRVTVCPGAPELGLMDDRAGTPGAAVVEEGTVVVGAAVLGAVVVLGVGAAVAARREPLEPLPEKKVMAAMTSAATPRPARPLRRKPRPDRRCRWPWGAGWGRGSA